MWKKEIYSLIMFGKVKITLKLNTWFRTIRYLKTGSPLRSNRDCLYSRRFNDFGQCGSAFQSHFFTFKMLLLNLEIKSQFCWRQSIWVFSCPILCQKFRFYLEGYNYKKFNYSNGIMRWAIKLPIIDNFRLIQ